MDLARQLEFLYEVGSLRNLQRSWRQFLGADCENDLEHTVRVCWIALLISRGERAGDESKILKMSLVHDLAESRTLDGTMVHKAYIAQDERRAADDALSNTGLEDILDLLADYKARGSVEARIVKDADNLEVDLELKELEHRGHRLSVKLAENRQRVRRGLFTETARRMWDAIQDSDPDAWHLRIRAIRD